MRGATTWFRAIGAALAATSVVGLVWTAVANPYGNDFFVRVGADGLVAIGIAWAAAARTYRGAWGRSALALFGVTICEVAVDVLTFATHGAGVTLFGLDLPSTGASGLDTSGSFAPRNEINLLAPSPILLAAAFLGLGLYSVMVRGAAMARRAPVRLVLGAVLALQILWSILVTLREGALIQAAIATVAGLWLAWALVRIRAGARRGGADADETAHVVTA